MKTKLGHKCVMSKKRRNNITFLLTQDLESPSGLGRYLPLAKNLSKQGMAISIFALHANFDSLKARTFFIENVHMTYVAQMHVKKGNSQTSYFNALNLIWYSLKATWKLLINLLNNPTDTIIIGKPHPMNSIAGLIGGRFHRAKIILDCDDYEAASNYFSSPWQKWVVKFFEDTMPKLVDHVTTNTYFNKERMIDLGVSADKIDYLPNGIDQERFQNLDPFIESQIKQSLNLEGKKVIAYIGSLSLANHPVDLLIRAFKLIAEMDDSAYLLIVGGGKDIDVLRAMVKDNQLENSVHLVGRVPPDLVPYYYKLADVTVDPVYDDDAAKGRCPLKIFESWVMNTPFVTAGVGDRRTLASDPPAALFFEAGNYSDLATKLLHVINNEEKKDQLNFVGINLVQSYEWSTITNEFIKWIKCV
jgi:glycosyltransferase involved in cell wall biosynthesis